MGWGEDSLMPSSLPTDTIDRKVRDFGIGTYDSSPGGESEYNPEGDPEAKKSLPGVPCPKEEDDKIVGDAYAPTSDVRNIGSAELPGDFDIPPRGKKPVQDTVQAPIESVAVAELPSDKDNPPARADYYDRTKVGDTMLPGTAKNENSLDKFLGSLGNWWSGFELDDVAQPTSFPNMDRPSEEADKYVNVPMGTASAKPRDRAMMRQATNLDLVGTLTSDFLKKNGKKGLTRRHVMAFLREGGYHQYLASDIVRCLQQRHDVHVADVLDQFPVATGKVASENAKLSTSLRVAALSRLVDIESSVASLATCDRDAAKALRGCSDDIMKLVAELVRGLEDG
jgi:hypothetical protein